MNTVLLELNSYAQTVRLFINGTQPSVHSELANFNFQKAINCPGDFLAAIGREINDDYLLLVTGNAYEHCVVEQAAATDAYCTSCRFLPAPVSLSSQERAERLGVKLQANTFTVCVDGSAAAPAEATYGNVRISFTKDKSIKADLQVAEDNVELVLSACETYLVNPAIGKAVAALTDCPNEIAICSRISPLLIASVPSHMEVGQQVEVTVSTYPSGSKAPKVSLKSSKPNIVSADGMCLEAHSSGEAIIQVFADGEVLPFFSQSIVAHKSILVSKLEFVDLKDVLQEGKTVPLSVRVYPTDAEDAGSVVFETSNPSVANIVDGNLVLVGCGECVISARTSKAVCSKEIKVQGKLAQLKLSVNTLDFNVGQMAPIGVEITPPDAYNQSYKWVSSDKSVAVVVKDDDKEYIKGVGIGSCEIACRSSDGTLSDTCAVTVNSIMYGRQKKKSKLLSFLLGGILACTIFSLCYTIFDVVLTTARSAPKGDDYLSFLVSGTTLAEQIEIANGYIFESEFVEDPYWSKTKWQPTEASYLGYFISERREDYYLFIVHEAKLVNPDAIEPKTMYSIVRFAKDDDNTLVPRDSEPIWADTLNDWLRAYTDNDNICDTSFSDEEIYALLGWDQYVCDAGDLSTQDIALLTELCLIELDSSADNLCIDSAYLYLSEDNYSSARNRLIVYIKQTSRSDSGTDGVVYYHPVRIDNLMFTTDDNGNATIDITDLDIDVQDYVMAIPENTGLVKLDCSGKLESVDVFAGCEMTFSGVNSEGKCEFSFASSDEFIAACRFEYDPKRDLSDGDVVTAKITNVEHLVKTFRKKPKELTMTYTVSGLSTYITSVNQIPLDELAVLANDWFDAVKSKMQDDGTNSYENFVLQGCYFVQQDDNDYCIWIVVSYEHCVDIFNQRSSEYQALRFARPILHSDGTLDLTISDGRDYSGNGAYVPDERTVEIVLP